MKSPIADRFITRAEAEQLARSIRTLITRIAEDGRRARRGSVSAHAHLASNRAA